MIESALEGRLGTVVHDDPGRAARIDLGCYTILAGDAGSPTVHAWLGQLATPVELIVPPQQAWRDVVDRQLGGHYEDRPMRTFATHALDPARLASLGVAPEGFRLIAIDRDLAAQLDASLSPHAMQVFPTPESFADQGIGFAAIAPDGRVAAQSSSYAISASRVEVAVAAHPDFRRRGLARAVAARMVATCLTRGLHPEWSASNPISKRLARSLGYRPADLCDIFYLPGPTET